MKSEYHGVYAALVTPYTSEGKVDYRELQKLVDYLICQGQEGFYVNGSTAEAFLLSEEERNSTIRAVVEANSGRAKVICHVGAISTEQAISFAKNAEKCGADAVVAEGYESGGHVGESTTMTLVPQVCDAVNIPVIAAGGIADGRGIAAALMLGAEGVQMGTRFVVTKECHIHPAYKERILKAKDIDTKVTGRSTGHPVRALRNDMTKRYLELEQAGASMEELEYLTLGAFRSAVSDGDVLNGSVMAGQIAGMIHEETDCRTLIRQLIEDAEKRMKVWR